MTDPTELAAQETSRRLHSLFNQAPVGVALLHGPRYVIEQANRAVCRFWGRAPEQVLGKPLFEALPEVAGQGFEQLLDGVFKTGVPYVGKELPARLARLEGGASRTSTSTSSTSRSAASPARWRASSSSPPTPPTR